MLARIAVVLVLLGGVARADTAADAQATLDAWLAAQNGKDFAAYVALYDARFVGIKRTSDGGEKKLKWAKWKKDRKKMFRRKQEVVAEDVKIEASDAGATVTFLQRWRGGGYADHGTKVLSLRTVDGALKIVREELLSSTPGWEGDPDKVLDATALVSPIEVRVRGVGRRAGCCDCPDLITYVIYLKDAEGTTLSHEIGWTYVPDDIGKKTTTIKAAPAETGLFSVTGYCRDIADTYDVVKSGDALVVTGSTTDAGEFGSGTELTVELPRDAKVKAKK